MLRRGEGGAGSPKESGKSGVHKPGVVKGALSSERERREDEARDLLKTAINEPDELRERFLSFITHEMRNPLASALWAGQMLSRKPDDPARVERLGALTVRSLSRLRGLFEDFFAMERLAAEPEEGETLLSQALSRALEPHALEPEGIPAEVEGLNRRYDPCVPLDPELLDELLHACLRRMQRVSANGTPIEIRVSSPDSDETCELSFFRSGLEVETLDPPLLSPAGAEGEGTTFTLMLARLAAARLGVELWVQQDEQGSSLRLRLPVK